MPRHRRLRLPDDLDPLIRPLVESLSDMGLETCGSCEGHPRESRSAGSASFPLVIFRPSKRIGLVHTLAYIVQPRGWCWYRQQTGTQNLELHWIIEATSSPPYLNPTNYGDFCLTPLVSFLKDTDPEYPAQLARAHRDLPRIVSGIQLYLSEIGLLEDPLV